MPDKFWSHMSMDEKADMLRRDFLELRNEQEGINGRLAKRITDLEALLKAK